MKEARRYLNPCMFSGVIYLCGYNSLLLEAFSPKEDTFLTFTIAVPEKTYSCMYVDSGQLVVHFQSYIRKYTAGVNGALVMQSEVRKQVACSSHSSQPVIDKTRGFYYIVCGGGSSACYCYNLETGVQGPSVA